jgi:hypothetical protein
MMYSTFDSSNSTDKIEDVLFAHFFFLAGAAFPLPAAASALAAAFGGLFFGIGILEPSALRR